jgi:fatty acid desaturase
MSSPPTHNDPVISKEMAGDSPSASREAGGRHPGTHWASRAAFSLIGAGLLISQVALGMAVYHRWFWLAVPLVLLVSHFMHGGLIGFHEASHGMLRKNRFLNDLDGIFAGMLSFMSFTLYRVAHQTHHLHLATERDVELWPFVIVSSPRRVRRLVAFIELNAGLVFTPYLFARVFFQKGSPIKNRKVRRRIWAELVLIAVFWSLAILAVAHWHIWTYFLWLYLFPAIIAGNLQSWRKYIEHVGLSGHTAKSATRSIIADTWSGRLLSLTLLHEPFHAVHHLRVGLPHAELPRHAALLVPAVEGEVTPFPNYRSALMDLLRNLSDPRSGSHWPDRKTKTIP